MGKRLLEQRDRNNIFKVLTGFILKENADKVFGIVSSRDIRSIKVFNNNGYKDYGEGKLHVWGKVEEETERYIEKISVMQENWR